jgi:hypothetical protein
MSERMSLVLIVSISTVCLSAVVGIVILQVLGREVGGYLPSVAMGALVSLTGLITVWAQNLKAQVEVVSSKIDVASKKADTAVIAAKAAEQTSIRKAEELKTALAENTALTAEVAGKVNGEHDRLVAEVKMLREEQAAGKSKQSQQS